MILTTLAATSVSMNVKDTGTITKSLVRPHAREGTEMMDLMDPDEHTSSCSCVSAPAFQGGIRSHHAHKTQPSVPSQRPSYFPSRLNIIFQVRSVRRSFPAIQIT